MVVPIELCLYLGMFFDRVALSILQMSDSVDVSVVYHGPVEEFHVLFPLFEPLYSGILSP